MYGLLTDLRYRRISSNTSNIYLMFPTYPAVLFSRYHNLLLDLLPHLLCFLQRLNLQFLYLNKALFRVLQDLPLCPDNQLKWMSIPQLNIHQITYLIQNLSCLLKCNPTIHQLFQPCLINKGNPCYHLNPYPPYHNLNLNSLYLLLLNLTLSITPLSLNKMDFITHQLLTIILNSLYFKRL